mmetsp:Transcript_148651/g.477305  ORF Transcript_148651/g.477305 Transcript_148651/m.477305 type:complete len:355 (+) Transcript_148651:756-1820(+)
MRWKTDKSDTRPTSMPPYVASKDVAKCARESSAPQEGVRCGPSARARAAEGYSSPSRAAKLAKSMPGNRPNSKKSVAWSELKGRSRNNDAQTATNCRVAGTARSKKTPLFTQFQESASTEKSMSGTSPLLCKGLKKGTGSRSTTVSVSSQSASMPKLSRTKRPDSLESELLGQARASAQKDEAVLALRQKVNETLSKQRTRTANPGAARRTANNQSLNLVACARPQHIVMAASRRGALERLAAKASKAEYALKNWLPFDRGFLGCPPDPRTADASVATPAKGSSKRCVAKRRKRSHKPKTGKRTKSIRRKSSEKSFFNRERTTNQSAKRRQLSGSGIRTAATCCSTQARPSTKA